MSTSGFDPLSNKCKHWPSCEEPQWQLRSYYWRQQSTVITPPVAAVSELLWSAEEMSSEVQAMLIMWAPTGGQGQRSGPPNELQLWADGGQACGRTGNPGGVSVWEALMLIESSHLLSSAACRLSLIHKNPLWGLKETVQSILGNGVHAEAFTASVQIRSGWSMTGNAVFKTSTVQK